MVCLSGLSFLRDKIRIARFWKFLALAVCPRCSFRSFSRGVYTKNCTTQKLRGKLQFLQECRIRSSGFVPTRESVRFGYFIGYCRSSDVDPTVTAVVGFYEANSVQDNTKIASESEGFRSERCAMVSPRKQERRPCVSMGFKGREGERRRAADKVETRRFDSPAREKIDGTFLCSAQYHRSTAGIFQPRPFTKFNVIRKSNFLEKDRIAGDLGTSFLNYASCLNYISIRITFILSNANNLYIIS